MKRENKFNVSILATTTPFSSIIEFFPSVFWRNLLDIVINYIIIYLIPISDSNI